MNKTEWKELETLLSAVTDKIPGAMTDRLWVLYSKIYSETKAKPCTCNRSTWVSIITGLRSALEDRKKVVTKE